MVQRCFTATKTYGSLERGAQDDHLDSHATLEKADVPNMSARHLRTISSTSSSADVVRVTPLLDDELMLNVLRCQLTY